MKTSDLYMASMFICRGRALKDVVQETSRRCSFVFDGTEDDLRDLTMEWMGGKTEVNARQYAETVGKLKALVGEKLRRGEP